MRHRYCVCYDVGDTQRCQKIFKTMMGYGDHVQYSVFICDLSDSELLYMRQDLERIINRKEDRVLVVDTGAVDSARKRIFVMGISIKGGRDASIVI